MASRGRLGGSGPEGASPGSEPVVRWKVVQRQTLGMCFHQLPLIPPSPPPSKPVFVCRSPTSPSWGMRRPWHNGRHLLPRVDFLRRHFCCLPETAQIAVGAKSPALPLARQRTGGEQDQHPPLKKPGVLQPRGGFNLSHTPGRTRSPEQGVLGIQKTDGWRWTHRVRGDSSPWGWGDPAKRMVPPHKGGGA